MNRVPNTKVWLLGKEYLEAAESLVDDLKLWPAAIMASLAIEVFLKSFSAKRNVFGYLSTNRGHSLQSLFSNMADADKAELSSASKEIDPSVDLPASLAKYNEVFTAARYRYEEASIVSVGNDVVKFARHLCEATSLIGKRRGT